MILTCTSLTGCKLQDNISNILQGVDTKSLKDTVAEDNLFAMSSKTKKAQQNALAMSDKAADYANKAAEGSNWIWPFSMAQNAYYDAQADKYAKKSVNATNEYESFKASDSTWLKDRLNAGKEGANTASNWRKYSWIIFFAIVLLIFFLLKMFKQKKRQAKMDYKLEKQELKVEKIAAKHGALPDTSESQAVLVDRNLEKSIASCKKYCEKYGIDYDTYLAQHNGDPKALLDFLIASSADDFK